MGWIVSAVGLAIVLMALWDIFHTLWHPRGFGRIARAVFQLVWRATKRRVPGRTRQLAGPIGVLGTVLTWTGLVVVGWMLVYLPRMPEGFYFGSSLRPGDSSDVLAAFYLSLVTVATLGFGDITPADPFLRLVTPFEALLGFVLLTAAISWVLQVYPALGRRRSVAKRLSIMRTSRADDVVATGNASVASGLLEAVTGDAIQAETDLLQYAESYYFLDEEESMSLAANLPYALTMAEAGRRSVAPEVRFAAEMLSEAVESLARRLDRVYLKTGGAASEILESYARDHGFDTHA